MGVKVKEWKGAWWVFINHQGRRRAKRCASKKAANAIADKIDAALKLGQSDVLGPGPARVPTFAEYADVWLRALETAKIRLSSAEQYRTRLRVRIPPLIGDLPLTAITRERVRALIGEMIAVGNQRTASRRPPARETVKAALRVAQAILARATEDGLIPRNPATGLAREIGKTEQPEVEGVEVFRPEELTTLLTTTEQDWLEWYPFVLCLARTGLRLGEAIGLEWRDVEFEQRLLIIRRSRRKNRVSIPKNGKARRVDMSQQLARVLQGLQLLQQAEAALAGAPAAERVFSTPTAKPIRDDAFRNNVWARILLRAGLRYRKPHTLRHTFASLLIEAGEPLTCVQEQLGHHSPAFTLGVYGHLLPRGTRRAVDCLDDPTFRNPRATDRAKEQAPVSDAEYSHEPVSNFRH
jgi:integrase